MVDPRFGRCNIFIIVDTETMQVTVMPNSSIVAAHGAGIGASQAVAGTGVKAVLTGQVGPNAHMALSQAGVKVYTGAHGTVRQAVEAFKRGELREVSSPTVGGHYGQGGRGMGGGMGGGMGQGRRRG
jgi:predicted Fe-Mo cluster-binding NifX family protein